MRTDGRGANDVSGQGEFVLGVVQVVKVLFNNQDRTQMIWVIRRPPLLTAETAREVLNIS